MTERETRRARSRRQNTQASRQQPPAPRLPPDTESSVRIRPCHTADLPAAGALLAQLEDVVLERWVSAAVADGRFGQGLSPAHAGDRAGLSALIQRAWNPAMGEDTFLNMCVPSGMLLVAEDPGHGVVGALLAYPPAAVIMQATRAAATTGYSAAEVIAVARTAMTDLIRIKALVVAPHQRGHGIGAALLDHCVQTYDATGFRFIYGQLVTAEGLAPYYTGHGFTVLEPGEGIRLDRVLGIGFGFSFGPGPGEQLFTRWHGHAPADWRIPPSRSR